MDRIFHFRRWWAALLVAMAIGAAPGASAHDTTARWLSDAARYYYYAHGDHYRHGRYCPPRHFRYDDRYRGRGWHWHDRGRYHYDHRRYRDRDRWRHRDRHYRHEHSRGHRRDDRRRHRHRDRD